jgi:hypothetical protein
MKSATFEFNIKNRQALAAVTEVKKSIHEFSVDAVKDLRSVVVGFVGFEAIKGLVEHTIEWAKNLERSSNLLNINADKLQTLRLIFKDIGKDDGAIGKMLTKLQGARQAAITNPKGTQARIFSAMGISQNEIATAGKTDFMEKVFANRDKGNVNSLIGTKLGEETKLIADKLGNFGNVMKEEQEKGLVSSNEDIDAAEAAADAMEELADVIRVKLLPVMTAFIMWIMDKIGNVGHAITSVKTLNEEANKVAKQMNVKRNSNAFSRAGADSATAYALANPKGNTDEEKMRYRIAAGKELVKRLYNEDVAKKVFQNNDVWKNVAFPKENSNFLSDIDEKFKRRLELRRQQRLNREHENIMPAKPAEEKMAALEKLPTNARIAVGGVMTGDLGYRVSRTREEMAEHAKTTADNTSTMVGQLDELIDIAGSGGFEAGS